MLYVKGHLVEGIGKNGVNMTKILSFIIPAYNSEKYIEKCLNSFLVKECLAEIEVIIVNDGSLDRTPEIAMDFVKKFPTVFKLYSQENKGHGGAINEGVKHISGRFFKVIDADDWIKEESLKLVLKELQCAQEDVVLLPYHTVNMKTGERCCYGINSEEARKSCSLREIVENWGTYSNGATFHGMIYNTEFYRRNKCILSEKVFYEDHEFATIPCCLADSVLVLSKISLYEYMIGNAEQSVSLENQVKRSGHMEQVINHMLEFYYANNTRSSFSKEYFLKKLEAFLMSYYAVLCMSASERKKNRKKANQYLKAVFERLPECKIRLCKKTAVLQVLSKTGISMKHYQKIVNSAIYKKIRGYES